MTVFRSRVFLLIAALGLIAAACGSGVDAGDEVVPAGSDAATEATDDDTATTDEHSEDEAAHSEDEAEGHGDEMFVFGEPGDPAGADRTVEILANDDFTFDPADLTVTAGETITFVVTNTGVIPHDFTLGDAATQDAHDAEMLEMMASGEMHEEPNAVVVGPGETAELTWTFTEAGQVLIGCHQPGHYAAGMAGEIAVEA